MSDLLMTDFDPMGMLAIRADLAALGPGIARALDMPVPDPLCVSSQDQTHLLWFSPDEMLLMCAPDVLAHRQARLSEALSGTHHLLADVSDMRVGFTLSGPRLREVLAKLVPVDTHPDVLRLGHVRRTHLAQVAAAVWMVSDDTAHLLCFRSVAPYVRECLTTAAQPGGTVGLGGK